MKKRILITAFSFFVSSSAFAQSGIPTIDLGTIAQLQAQLQQMKAQLDAVLGNKTDYSGSIHQDPVPSEWSEIYDLANINVDMIQDTQGFDEQASIKNLIAVYEQSKVALSDTQNRLNTLQALQAEIANTKGTKESADLQNRISAEQAMIANNQVKLDQMSRMYSLQQDVLYQQRAKYDNCLLINRNNPNVCR